VTYSPAFSLRTDTKNTFFFAINVTVLLFNSFSSIIFECKFHAINQNVSNFIFNTFNINQLQSKSGAMHDYLEGQFPKIHNFSCFFICIIMKTKQFIELRHD